MEWHASFSWYTGQPLANLGRRFCWAAKDVSLFGLRRSAQAAELEVREQSSGSAVELLGRSVDNCEPHSDEHSLPHVLR